MGPEFVGRVIRTSAWVAPLAALYVGVYYDLGFAGAILVGTAWACVNLYLIRLLVEKLIRQGDRRKKDAIILGCVKFPLLYGLGYVALRADALPVLGLLAGFWIPKAIIVLKSLGVLLNRHYDVRRGSAFGIGLVLVAGLWLVPQLGAGTGNVSAGQEVIAAAPAHESGAIPNESDSQQLRSDCSFEVATGGHNSKEAAGSHSPDERTEGRTSEETAGSHSSEERTEGHTSDEATGSHSYEQAGSEHETQEAAGSHSSTQETRDQGHGEAAAYGSEEHEAAHEEEGGHTELPNFVTVVEGLLPHGSSVGQFLKRWENLTFSLLSVLILGLIVSAATRHRRLVPGRLQNTIELLVENLDNFICGILGPQGRRYVPFLGSLFIYILFMNLFGLIPGMKSPTANLNQTLALALCVFLYVQYTGIRNFGIKGYLFHMAGEPRDPITFALVPIMLPLHIIGELAKPLSLSLRLFGNITGEDVLIVIFVTLGIGMIGFLHLPIGIPLQVPFIFLAILTSTIQALVFTLLSTVYFLMMMPHEEH